jgi:hypothetical protein
MGFCTQLINGFQGGEARGGMEFHSTPDDLLGQFRMFQLGHPVHPVNPVSHVLNAAFKWA